MKKILFALVLAAAFVLGTCAFWSCNNGNYQGDDPDYSRVTGAWQYGWYCSTRDSSQRKIRFAVIDPSTEIGEAPTVTVVTSCSYWTSAVSGYVWFCDPSDQTVKKIVWEEIDQSTNIGSAPLLGAVLSHNCHQ